MSGGGATEAVSFLEKVRRGHRGKVLAALVRFVRLKRKPLGSWTRKRGL